MFLLTQPPNAGNTDVCFHAQLNIQSWEGHKHSDCSQPDTAQSSDLIARMKLRKIKYLEYYNITWKLAQPGYIKHFICLLRNVYFEHLYHVLGMQEWVRNRHYFLVEQIGSSCKALSNDRHTHENYRSKEEGKEALQAKSWIQPQHLSMILKHQMLTKEYWENRY